MPVISAGGSSARKTLARLAIAAAFAGLLLGACAETGEPDLDLLPSAGLPAPEDGRGRIVFYRPQGSLFPGLHPRVIVNGRLVGESRDGAVFYRDAWPGDYEVFLTSDRDDRLTLSLEAGESLYVRTSVDFALSGPYLAPRLVDADDGRREVQGLGLIEAPPEG